MEEVQGVTGILIAAIVQEAAEEPVGVLGQKWTLGVMGLIFWKTWTTATQDQIRTEKMDLRIWEAPVVARDLVKSGGAVTDGLEEEQEYPRLLMVEAMADHKATTNPETKTAAIKLNLKTEMKMAGIQEVYRSGAVVKRTLPAWWQSHCLESFWSCTRYFGAFSSPESLNYSKHYAIGPQSSDFVSIIPT
jgi:hypothetical protein